MVLTVGRPGQSLNIFSGCGGKATLSFRKFAKGI